MSFAEWAIALISQKRTRRHLSGRVALIALGAIACWLLVLTFAFNLLLARQLDDQRTSVARARATAAAATVRFTPGGRPLALESAGDAALDYGIWIYAGTAAIQRPRADAQLQGLADSLAMSVTRGHAAPTLGNQLAVLYAIRVQHRNHSATIVIASASLSGYRQVQHAALLGSVALSVLLLAGSYPVLRLAGRRALAPVEQMTHQAREWSARAPDLRFGSGQRFVELRDLATTLDDVLDRLSAVLRHERQLPAELSHELRTPLSSILAEADLLAARFPDERGPRAIRESAQLMDDITETLLTTSRTELQSAGSMCDPREAVEALIAGRAGRFQVVSDAQVTVGADARVVTRLLAPIIDNSARHAASTTTVAIRRDAHRVIIDITNDGPPVPAADRERIFAPGISGGAGAGLGLSLARRLARAADGDVTCRPTTEGALFRVTLPHG